jgi:hypothetical protein
VTEHRSKHYRSLSPKHLSFWLANNRAVIARLDRAIQYPQTESTGLPGQGGQPARTG